MAIVSPHETRSIDLEASLDDDSSVTSLNPNFMLSETFFHIEIKGSCRGFILLDCSYTFYVWNPSTGLHKQIPLSPLSFILDEDAEYFYGFGYDWSTDDYLVVSMSSAINSSYLEFFSLKANTWKQIDEGTHIHYLNAIEDDAKVGLFFNGAIHWLAYHRDLREDTIVVFDLMERKLLHMHLPDDQIDLEILHYSGLWVFRENLSLLAWNYDDVTVEIWVMKEYKVHSSWTKTHVISTDAIPTSYFSPLCCTKCGDIVGTNDHSRVVKYNDVGHLLGHHSYFNNLHGSRAVMYSESLISLPRGNVQA